MPQTPDVFLLGFQFTLGAIAALGVVLLVETLLGALLGWLGGAWRQIRMYREEGRVHVLLPLASLILWLDRWLRR